MSTETPKFYLPDFNVQWDVQQLTSRKTESIQYRSGALQRRAQWNQRLRAYKLKNAMNLSQDDRRALYDFFWNVAQGSANSFYFWEPSPRRFVDQVYVQGGTTAQVFGTAGGGDIYNITSQYKGPYWLNQAIQNLSFDTFGGSQKVYVNTSGIVSPASWQSIPPRGNNFITYLFNGYNSYGNAGAAVNTRQTGNQLWAVWVFMRPSFAGSWVPIASSRESTPTNGCLFYIESNFTLNFITYHSGVSSSATSSFTIPFNTWVHVAAALSGSTVTFYLNGVQYNSVTSIGTPTASTTNLSIGFDAAAARYFHGAMNDFRIVSGTYTSQQISELYNGQIPYGGGPSTIPWDANAAIILRMDDGIGATSFADITSNAYNASIVNASNDRWVGGETEISFLASESGGALYIPGMSNARQRLTCIFANDDLPESFLQAYDGNWPLTQFDIQIREVI